MIEFKSSTNMYVQDENKIEIGCQSYNKKPWFWFTQKKVSFLSVLVRNLIKSTAAMAIVLHIVLHDKSNKKKSEIAFLSFTSGKLASNPQEKKNQYCKILFFTGCLQNTLYCSECLQKMQLTSTFLFFRNQKISFINAESCVLTVMESTPLFLNTSSNYKEWEKTATHTDISEFSCQIYICMYVQIQGTKIHTIAAHLWNQY